MIWHWAKNHVLGSNYSPGILQGASLFKGRKVWVIFEDLLKSFLRLNNLMIFKMCITTGVCNMKEQNLKHTGRKRFILFSSVLFSCSVMFDSATPWTAACQASLCITNSQSLLKLMSIELVMPSNYLILCCPLLLLPSMFPSISLFWWVSSSHQVAKVLELQL